MSPIVIILGVLFLVVLFLLFRVQQLASVLSGELKSKIPAGNKFNGSMLLLFFVVGMVLFFYSSAVYWDDMHLPLASEHGATTDFMFWLTMWICVIVFVGVNGVLFYFSFKYQDKGERKAYFFPHNNTLEMIWTLVPAVVLSILVFGGWKTWTGVTGAAPDDSAVIEIMGKQFAWMVRYPGDDGKLGSSHYTLIDDVNEIGMDCKDKNGYDDFIPREIHLVVNKPVLMKIRARDVLHSVFLPHFRQKMDAVPGMPTRMWFTPTKTTAEMRIELDNPDFKYELACTEVCGRGHFAMKKIVVVETQEEYDAWYAKQKPYFVLNQEKACVKEFLPASFIEELNKPTESNDTSSIENIELVIEDGMSDSLVTNLSEESEVMISEGEELVEGEGEEKKVGFIKKIVEKAKDVVSKDSTK